MSRCILLKLKSCGRSYQHAGAIALNLRSYCRGKNGNNDKPPLGKSTIIVQQGCDIQELPVILRKIKKDEFAAICDDKIENFEVHSPIENNVKPEEIIPILDNCTTAAGILSVVYQIPESNLCLEIAAHAFDKLIRGESIVALKNLEDSSEVFDKLVRCVLKNGDQTMLLDFMEVLKKALDLQKTVQRFCDELLMRSSDGILNIIEICECIDLFVDCKQQASAEKFWVGISDNEKMIDDKNIKFIYKILPKLKESRRSVIGVVERRIIHVWWHLSPDAVAESLKALVQCNCSPYRTMQSFSRWLNTNIHAVNESNLESIIKSFSSLHFSNNQVEKALERYIKAKGVKIQAQSLILAILEYCEKFRVRNHHILNGCCEYFITHHEKIDPAGVKSIITPFGYLDFQPLNNIRFWQVVEKYLQDNFSRVPALDLIAIFLNCCYLQVYPLNFVSSVFNPYFLDSLHTSAAPEDLAKIRSDLKLFDAALTLECANYTGPLLPRDHSAKSIWQDGRIRRIANSINDYVEKIAGGPDNFTKNVIIGKLPTNSLYIVDILIHPAGIGNFWSYSIRNDKNTFVALLIHLPEYFNSCGEHLIGPQVMRIRHLRRLGMKVVTLQYDTLAQLKVHPRQLEKYLVERMKQALSALPGKDDA